MAKKQLYEAINTTEFTSDWYYNKKVQIEKGYWHKLSLTLRYGGGISGHTSWYLTAERFKDGETCESIDYPIIYINEAVKCYEILPIKEIRTYDNIQGLHEFIKRIGAVAKVF